MVNGGIYAISAPVWGYLCDKKLPGKLVTAVGALLIAGSFVFLGPIRIVPFPTTYEVCIAALVAHGVGFAAALVSGKLSSLCKVIPKIVFLCKYVNCFAEAIGEASLFFFCNCNSLLRTS